MITSTSKTKTVQPISYEDMVKVGLHFGRKKTIFHPNMKPYVYTSRDNIYILDLIKTSEKLAEAISFIRSLIEDGKVILFIGTAKQASQSIKEVAEALSMPYVNYRWLGGTLTNHKVISERVRHMENLEKEKSTGGFEKYTKKERLDMEKEIETLRLKYDGIRKLTRLPDAIFVSSLKENILAVKEAKIMKIIALGIVNTDSDPRQLTYPIPANDTSRQSIELILTSIKNNLQGVQAKPKAEKNSK